MKTEKMEKFRQILLEKRVAIVQNATNTLDSGMVLEVADLPDYMDQASSEEMQSFQFRLRGRERFFFARIEEALSKIDQDIFGICEECERRIQPKRLEARPEARLCIKCKEKQEREERQYRS